MSDAIVWPGSAVGREVLGGKAASLDALMLHGFDVPGWFVVRGDAGDCWENGLREALLRLAPRGERVAVRSSAREEDGAAHSYAGQFESYLGVAHEDVAARVRDVWRSAESARVERYRSDVAGRAESTRPAVLVQRMVHAEVAGVAFSADPTTGQRGVAVVAATPGLGAALVGGEEDADSWRVARDGAVLDRRIATKRVRQESGVDGVREVAIAAELASAPALEDDDVRRVAALARRAAAAFGAPQDIEWAMEGGRLHLLQSRAITSLAALADPDGALAIWDNSNIAESYGGVTTPMTYSFARYAYEHVYRQFLRIVGVSDAKIEENGGSLRTMIGLVRGRVYYNLLSWYRALALLPGFRLNRRFMEQMMGVREGMPEEIVRELGVSSRGEKWRDTIAVARMAIRLAVGNARIARSVREFHARLHRVLDTLPLPLSELRPDELAAHYRELERELLTSWDAPLLNDFFAMIHHGALRRLVEKWGSAEHASIHNDLVAADGQIVSAEPARRIREMGRTASHEPALVAALSTGTPAQAQAAARANARLRAELDDYLARFGDRCLEELKLETETLVDDSMPLLRAIGRAAQARLREKPPAHAVDIRADAERRLRAMLAGRPLRRWIAGRVLSQARARVRDRENLRFERTRVFGRVRRIVLELGRRLAAMKLLDDARDVFYLQIDELLGTVEGTGTTVNLRGLVALRRAEYEGWRREPAPADRFETRGIVHGPHDHRGAPSAPEEAVTGESRVGTGCYPGTVRGRARVVHDPREAELQAGEILVAERTDPGWVMLFPAAAGLLVERGSLLSHSAIVARELGLPAVIAVPGLTAWLRTGDEVELDGRTGVVRRLAPETADAQ
ncbi:MAG: phosphoenolpyruvate synthase [Gemmatimonadaceae bacterium]|nr:phosphoenolpyruvate synthase [Gemmatimonadaceae bacterium]NUQ93947.1 phosphoenolpyruvate synthase [Gemmatimonadaceae bacterium]